MPRVSIKSSMPNVRLSIQKIVCGIAPTAVRGIQDSLSNGRLGAFLIQFTSRVKTDYRIFAGWEGWLAPAASKGSTSKVYLWLLRKLTLSSQRGQATLPNLRICSLELSTRNEHVSTAILILAIILAAMASGGCRFGVGAKHLPRTPEATSLIQEEKHKLYSAALAASDSPLDTELFKEACKKIGIFDADGNPNGNYMAFVQEHIVWGMKPETSQFRMRINTKEKAKEYVTKHLPP